MSIGLHAAFASARSVSLHCTAGGRDALYDLQMVPVEAGSAIMWSVHSQHGRRGGRLSESVHCEGVSFATAATKYNALHSEKTGKKRYDVVPNTRQSILTPPAAAPAPLEETVTLPDWPGFQNFFNDVAEYFTGSVSEGGLGHALTIAQLAVLTDLAYSSSEGVPDAVLQVKATNNTVELERLLSPEALACVAPATRKAALEEIRAICSLI